VPAVVTYIGEADALRAQGLAVVTYAIHWEKLAPRGAARPAPAPGERRYGQWLLATPDARRIGQGDFGLIAGDAENTVPEVLDWVTTLPEIDAGKIGIVGASTYGFVALQAAADPRIVAAAAIVACGDYHRFLYLSTLGMNGEFLDLEPGYESWLHQREPVRRPERLVHAAVLMVNGADDVAVPAVCARRRRACCGGRIRAGVPERYRFVLVEVLATTWVRRRATKRSPGSGAGWWAGRLRA
jgi:dienelactone hydrolase